MRNAIFIKILIVYCNKFYILLGSDCLVRREDKIKPYKEKTMDYAIEQLPAQQILYMRRTGAYGAENYALMESLKKWANDRGLLNDSTIYGIARDDPNTPPDQCRYDVCLVVDADYTADPQVQKGELPGGKYAVFKVPHTAEAVQAFWASAMQTLQEKGLQYTMTGPILERYQYHVVSAGECEFCVPVND